MKFRTLLCKKIFTLLLAVVIYGTLESQEKLANGGYEVYELISGGAAATSAGFDGWTFESKWKRWS